MTPEIAAAIDAIKTAFANQRAADQTALDNAVSAAKAAHADDIVQMQALVTQLQAGVAAVTPTADVSASPVSGSAPVAPAPAADSAPAAAPAAPAA